MKQVKGSTKITQAEHADASDAKRVISGGLVADQILSDINTSAELVGERKHVVCTNVDSTTVYYVNSGDAAMAAPGAAAGIAVPPLSQVTIFTGENDHIRANSTNIHAVVLA